LSIFSACNIYSIPHKAEKPRDHLDTPITGHQPITALTHDVMHLLRSSTEKARNSLVTIWTVSIYTWENPATFDREILLQKFSFKIRRDWSVSHVYK